MRIIFYTNHWSEPNTEGSGSATLDKKHLTVSLRLILLFIWCSCGVRIVCAECQPPVDMCAECFAAAVEVGSHKSHHPYRLQSFGKVKMTVPKSICVARILFI